MPRTTAPSTNPRILSGYAPYPKSRTNTTTSIAPKSRGSATTTEERRQLLVDDPHARDVHPEQVTCTRCAKTVRLQKGKKYHLAHWLDHRWRCDNAAVEPAPRAKCRTLPERKAILEADEDAKVVEPDRVMCAKCNKDVKLRKGRPYGLSSWTQHKMSCQAITQPAIASASVASSISSSPTPSERHTALTSDPLVAALDESRIKCALCLTWIDAALQTDSDAHAWRRHRASCVAENFSGDKLNTRPRFFRHRHRLGSASGSVSEGPDKDAHLRSSPDAEDHPTAEGSPSRVVGAASPCGSPAPDSGSPTRVAGMHASPIPPHVAPSIRIDTASPSSSCPSTPTRSPSPSSPPPLSFSAPTSAPTSAAPTPFGSPRRTHSLFPACSRRLPIPEHDKCAPFPEYTPLSLSRFAFDKRRIGPGALGLLLNPRSPSPYPASEHTPSPPPYPERTALSLPIPERYWRFESVE